MRSLNILNETNKKKYLRANAVGFVGFSFLYTWFMPIFEVCCIEYWLKDLNKCVRIPRTLFSAMLYSWMPLQILFFRSISIRLIHNPFTVAWRSQINLTFEFFFVQLHFVNQYDFANGKTTNTDKEQKCSAATITKNLFVRASVSDYFFPYFC